MRYYTISYPDHNTLGQDYVRWETLSEQDILNHYWDHWCEQMQSRGHDPEVMTFENCIDDWCVVHWAERNHWWEIKHNYA